MSNGLVVSGSGAVNLGGGSLTVNDLTSGLSGGSLSATNQYVGKGGTGLFTQSAGTNTLSAAVYLGYNLADMRKLQLKRHGQALGCDRVRGLLGERKLHAVGRHELRLGQSLPRL